MTAITTSTTTWTSPFTSSSSSSTPPKPTVLTDLSQLSKETGCQPSIRCAIIGRHSFVYVGFTNANPSAEEIFQNRFAKWINANPNVIAFLEGHDDGMSATKGMQPSKFFPMEDRNLRILTSCTFFLTHATTTHELCCEYTKGCLQLFLQDLSAFGAAGTDILSRAREEMVSRYGTHDTVQEIYSIISDSTTVNKIDSLINSILKNRDLGLSFFKAIIFKVINEKISLDEHYKSLAINYITEPYNESYRVAFGRTVAVEARARVHVKKIAHIANAPSHKNKIIVVIISVDHTERHLSLLTSALRAASATTTPPTTTTTTTQPLINASSTSIDGKVEAPMTTPTSD